jgi:hypothetical protein
MKMQLKCIAVLVVPVLAAIAVPPAIAYDGHAVQDPYTQAFRGYNDMRAQDALNFGRTDIYPRYHSVGAACLATAIIPARSMTILVPRIGEVGELP